MGEKTEAQKRAQKKYMASFVEVKVRMTPERRSAVQAPAEAQGERTPGHRRDYGAGQRRSWQGNRGRNMKKPPPVL